MSRFQFDMVLRGQHVSLDVFVLNPDPDVGIMSFGFEDELIRDQDGTLLAWELTDDENMEICDIVNDKANDYDGEPSI